MPYRVSHGLFAKILFVQNIRLPEDHRCVKLTQIRSKKFGEKKVIRDGGPKKGFLRRIFGRN